MRGTMVGKQRKCSLSQRSVQLSFAESDSIEEAITKLKLPRKKHHAVLGLCDTGENEPWDRKVVFWTDHCVSFAEE